MVPAAKLMIKGTMEELSAAAADTPRPMPIPTGVLDTKMPSSALRVAGLSRVASRVREKAANPLWACTFKPVSNELQRIVGTCIKTYQNCQKKIILYNNVITCANRNPGHNGVQRQG
jgi:hypothetical protein